MLKDLVGRVFGRLTVLERTPPPVPNPGRSAHWLCRCACGTEKRVSGHSLLAGATRSCGCFQRDRAHEVHTAHGGHKLPEWRAWTGMRQRCRNENHRLYPYYGGRGIKVAAEWEDFSAFYAAVGPRPSPKHSLDRIDNEKGYEPGNVRWATKRQQQENTRKVRALTFNGKTQSASAWAREIGISQPALIHRLDKMKLPVEQALSRGPTPRNKRFAFSHEKEQ